MALIVVAQSQFGDDAATESTISITFTICLILTT